MADDDRYLTVLSQIQDFLRRQDVIGVLDAGTGASSSTKSMNNAAPLHSPSPHPSSSSTSSASSSSSSITNIDAECGDNRARDQLPVPTSSLGVRMAMGSLMGELDFAATEKERRRRVVLPHPAGSDDEDDEEFTIGSLSSLRAPPTMAGDLHAMVEDMSGQFSSLMDAIVTSSDSSSSIRNEHIS
jgi:hypothetical protein